MGLSRSRVRLVLAGHGLRYLCKGKNKSRPELASHKIGVRQCHGKCSQGGEIVNDDVGKGVRTGCLEHNGRWVSRRLRGRRGRKGAYMAFNAWPSAEIEVPGIDTLA